MHMLNVVENQHGKESDLLRYDDEENRFFPVDDKSCRDPESEDRILAHEVPEESSVGSPLVLEIIADGFLLIVTADSRVSKQHEQVIMLREAIRDCVVAGAIIESVVVHVMRRYPREGGEAIKQREPIIGQRVHLFSAPDRDVIVVVSNHRHSDRKE